MIPTEQKVTEEQIRQMRHCLGLNYEKRPWRNYFYTSNTDNDWEELVTKGLATKLPGWDAKGAYYRLTYAAVCEIYGKPFSKKAYDKLR